jgi:hypothetical protein
VDSICPRKWGRRRLHKEFNEQASSPDIMLAIKSRGMRGAGLVARMGKRGGAFRFLAGNLRKREDPGVDGVIILNWIFRMLHWWHQLD